MPSDFAIHSDLLVHWTGKDIDEKYEPNWYEQPDPEKREHVDSEYIDRLCSILDLGLWMTMRKAWSLPGGGEVPAAPCLCFTELKLSHSFTRGRNPIL